MRLQHWPSRKNTVHLCIFFKTNDYINKNVIVKWELTKKIKFQKWKRGKCEEEKHKDQNLFWFNRIYSLIRFNLIVAHFYWSIYIFVYSVYFWQFQYFIEMVSLHYDVALYWKMPVLSTFVSLRQFHVGELK